VPTTPQVEPVSPFALHGFEPALHALTQVTPLNEKPVLQPQL
jgi:hypothetical protein